MNADVENCQVSITHFLKFSSPELRRWIVKILGAVKEKESLPALIAISENYPYPEEREIPDPLNASLDYYDRERETVYPIRGAALTEIMMRGRLLAS